MLDRRLAQAPPAPPRPHANSISNQFQHRHENTDFNFDRRSLARNERRNRAANRAREAEIHLRDASRSGDGSSGEMHEVRDDACSSETKKQTSNVQRPTSNPE